jgi:hypothetical protein
MAGDPLWYRWNGAAMLPMQPELAAQQFHIDGRYLLEAHHERSYQRHKAFFAAVHEAWTNLAAAEFPTPEHLRKFALIRTGWRDERVMVCASPEAAERLATFCRPFDSYAVMLADGPILRVWTAQSQSYRGMGRDRFNKSMEDVLNYCAGLISVSTEQLREQGDAA